MSARSSRFAIAVVGSRGFTSILVDVNRDSFRERNRRHLEGGFAHDATLVVGALVRPALLRRNERRRFTRLADKLFTVDVIASR